MEYLNTIMQGDVMDCLNKLKDNSIDMVVSSPPYLNQREYSQYKDHLDYSHFIYGIFLEIYRVLKEGSVIVWNIGDDRTIDLPSLSSQQIYSAGFKYQDTIIWQKNAKLGSRGAHIVKSKKYYPYFQHEHIFVYSKGDFSKRIDDDQLEYARKHNTNIWQLPTDHSKYEHPAKFDIELPSRAIKLYSNKGDVILDPFLGSGTAALAARDLGRNYIGIERNANYVKVAENRLNEKKGDI